MGLILCPDCNNFISDLAPACIHCGRPMDIPDNSLDYNIKLNTYRVPFTLDGFSASGKGTAVQITDIDYKVIGDTLYVDVRGKRTYRNPSTIRDQYMLQWTLRFPDKNESYGYYHMIDLFLGETFEFQIEETIYENGIYNLFFDVD